MSKAAARGIEAVHLAPGGVLGGAYPFWSGPAGVLLIAKAKMAFSRPPSPHRSAWRPAR